MIILDLGNGSVCKNNKSYIKDLIDSVVEVDKEKKCILKWQLFLGAIPPKEPLRRENYMYAAELAGEYGFETTASVFDRDSFDFLLHFKVPFIKVANNPAVKVYLQEFTQYRPLIVSYGKDKEIIEGIQHMCCVSEYPAKNKEYEKEFSQDHLKYGISDHTDNIELYKKYKPKIYEKHYTLDHVSTDAPRPYALRPEGLEELLEVT